MERASRFAVIVLTIGVALAACSWRMHADIWNTDAPEEEGDMD